jgi:hypothetical protein
VGLIQAVKCLSPEKKKFLGKLTAVTCSIILVGQASWRDPAEEADDRRSVECMSSL